MKTEEQVRAAMGVVLGAPQVEALFMGKGSKVPAYIEDEVLCVHWLVIADALRSENEYVVIDTTAYDYPVFRCKKGIEDKYPEFFR